MIKDILELAREAGLLSEDEAWVSLHQEAMERFAELLEAKVRADDRKLLEQALKALEVLTDNYDDNAVGIEIDAIVALRKRLAQPEQEIEPDRPHVEDDGCPTEKAVLQRFWREHHAQPKREPVAWMYDWYDETEDIDGVPIGGIVSDCISKDYDEAHSPTMGCHNIRPLYTAPQKREWKRLTDEEISEINKSIPGGTEVNLAKRLFAREIEAKLKEKNT